MDDFVITSTWIIDRIDLLTPQLRSWYDKTCPIQREINVLNRLLFGE